MLAKQPTEPCRHGLTLVLFECMSKDLCLRCGAGKPLLSTADGGRGAADQWILHAAN